MDIIKILTVAPIIQFFISKLFDLLETAGIPKNYYLMLFLVQLLAIFLPAYYFCRKIKKTSYLKFKDIQIEKKDDVFLFVTLGICLQFVGSIANYPLIQLFSKLGYEPSVNIPPITGITDFLLALLTVCFIPSVCEEILFRKLIYDDLRAYSKWTAIMFSAIFFAIAHMNFYNIGAIFFIGMIFGVMRARNFPLIYLMICHFFVNLTGILLNAAETNNLLSGMFEHHYTLILSVFLLIIGLILKQTSKYQEQREFNYYKRPAVTFLSSVFKSPYTYIYIAVFISMSIYTL
jgi:membrane protease YdiL (CAAX protease family)